MKKFIITETRPATYKWIYEVEAESQDKAVEMVMDGMILPINSDVDAYTADESEFKIQEV